LFARREKPVKRKLVLANVGVNQKRCFLVERAQHGKRRKRYLHLIAHAAHVEQHLVRTLLNQLPAERANHVERLSVRETRSVNARASPRYLIRAGAQKQSAAYQNSDMCV